MSTVLDASALLAYLQGEPGSDSVQAIISNSSMSTVNWAEVVPKISQREKDAAGLRADLESLGVVFAPFTTTQAEVAGALKKQTKEHGLSLGDRACIALGLELDAAIYTTDRIWKDIALAAKINVIR